jgi:hypothetical protein
MLRSNINNLICNSSVYLDNMILLTMNHEEGSNTSSMSSSFLAAKNEFCFLNQAATDIEFHNPNSLGQRSLVYCLSSLSRKLSKAQALDGIRIHTHTHARTHARTRARAHTHKQTNKQTHISGSATAITTGYAHTCALLADGNVCCWGFNGFSQLGLGTVDGADQSIPKIVPGLTKGGISLS